MMRLLRSGVCLAVLLIIGAGIAKADTLTFTDGQTVTGSFVYDATNNTIVSFNFTSTEFGGSSFVGPTTGISIGGVLTNADGDEVFGFDAVAPDGNTDELDLVVACNGVANCATGASLGNSFLLATGQPTCTPGQLCIASGEQKDIFTCLTSSCQSLLGGNNYLTITADPDNIYTMTVSTTPLGTVLNTSGNNGNGNNGGGVPAPEPSSLLLLGLGIGTLLLVSRKVRAVSLA